MNPFIVDLKPYPFERLRQLLASVTPIDKAPISLSIGEPQHASPEAVIASYHDNAHHLSHYPKTLGTQALRDAIATWLIRRYHLSATNRSSLADKHIVPLNGTREGLFAFVQAMVNPSDKPTVVMPNPGYQIYEGATLLAGGKPYYLNCTQGTDFLPDFNHVPASVWQQCSIVFICSPGNPTGAIMPYSQLASLIALADTYDFIIASDECYSEIYTTDAPSGLLETCARLGRHDFDRCVVFHSLSKRSNLPGLRSGFVAGDAGILSTFLRYRTYHGCAMSEATQVTSVSAWQDETHVHNNRQRYAAKRDAFLDTLAAVMNIPPLAQHNSTPFYLWLPTPIDDTVFCQRLYQQQHLTVLPGQYMARENNNINPGKGYVRLALVAEESTCQEAADRLSQYLKENHG